MLSAQPGISVAGAIAWPGHIAPPPQPSPPATVLVDLPDPPPELIRRFKAAMPQAGLLLLVPSLDLSSIFPLLLAGTTGFVSRDGTLGDLARAITRALAASASAGASVAVGRGELVLPPALAARAPMLLAQGQTPPEPPAESLSERQVEVLRLLAEGLTNIDIAQTLILSVRMLEAHLRSTFAIFGVRLRTEAALWAVKTSMDHLNRSFHRSAIRGVNPRLN